MRAKHGDRLAFLAHGADGEASLAACFLAYEFEEHDVVAQAQLVAMLEGHGSRDAGAIYPCAVRAFEVFDGPLAAMEAEPRVVA